MFDEEEFSQGSEPNLNEPPGESIFHSSGKGVKKGSSLLLTLG